MRALRSCVGAVWLGVMVCVSILGVAAVASAQGNSQRARQLYAEAQALFDSGQYAAAESSFRAAYAEVPNPVVLKAVASAQERQGNVSGAIETLRQYLEEAPTAPDRAEVEQRIEELSSQPATVAVSSTPPGASIVVDGTDTGQTTPADVSLSPGEHTVELRLTGYAPASQSFQAQAATRVRLEMTLEQGEADTGEDVFGENGGDGQGAETGGDEGGGGGSSEPSVGVWVTAGLGAAGLISGTVFGFLALSEQSNFDNTPTNDIADRGEAFALVADISFGFAAAMAITAVVLYIVESSSGGGDDDESAGLMDGQLQLGAFADARAGGVAAQLSF